MFNIQILEYITISEFILYFIEFIFNNLIYLIGSIFIYVIIELFRPSNNKDRYYNKISDKELKKTLHILYWVVFFVTVGISVIIYRDYLAEIPQSEKYSRYSLKAFPLFILLPSLLILWSPKKHKIALYATIYSLFFIFFCFFYLFMDGQIKAYKLMENRTNVIHNLEFDKEIDEINYHKLNYIGKTKNYIFLYDNKNAETVILLNKDIKLIKIKEL